MENALLIGLSRQAALKRQMDVIANNIANVSTAGYKRGTLKFDEYLMPLARTNDATGADARLSFTVDGSIYRNFAEGSFSQTGNDLDVAISGDGWLVVQTPDGERYTRNGQMKLNADGELVTMAGLPILGDGGTITFSPNATGIEIADDGTISTNEGGLGRLRLVEFEDNSLLKKEGALLFSSTQPPSAADDARIVQGMIEKSNVQPVTELATMIETLRAYTSVSRSLDQMQKLRQDAIERLSGATST